MDLTGLYRRLWSYAAAGALVVLFAAVGSKHPSTPVLVGAGALVIAAGVFVYVRLGAVRVILDDDGATVHRLFSTQHMAWSEVERYSFLCVRAQRAAGHGGLAGALVGAAVNALNRSTPHRDFAGGRLILHGAGRKLRIGRHYHDIDQVLDRAFAELHARLAKRTEFGALSFDGVTLRHATKGALSLAEIEKVELGSLGGLAIHKVGKRLRWASCSMARVDNVLLLVERLADRSVALEVSTAVFLPAPMLQRLAGVRAVTA